MVRASATANAEVATVLGSIPASSDTVESEGRQMKRCWIQYIEKKNTPAMAVMDAATTRYTITNGCDWNWVRAATGCGMQVGAATSGCGL